jgi:hypothetical protein
LVALLTSPPVMWCKEHFWTPLYSREYIFPNLFFFLWHWIMLLDWGKLQAHISDYQCSEKRVHKNVCIYGEINQWAFYRTIQWGILNFIYCSHIALLR